MDVNINFEESSTVKTKKLLTIAIPTFNRAEHLRVCLERFGSEFNALSLVEKDLLSIYISNNASTDNTLSVINEFIQNFPELTFVNTNSENIGGDQNIVKCYMEAESSYVWVFGDDDVIMPGSLSVILDVFTKNKIDMLFIPCRSYADMNVHDQQINDSRAEIITDPLIFSRRVNINLTFISAMIVRSKSFGEAEVMLLKNSNLSQLGWVFSLLINGHKFAILNNKMIAAKAANTGGYGLIKVFGENLQADSLLSERPKIARVLQNAVIIDFFPPHILALRNGESDFDLEADMPKELDRLFNGNWRYFVFIVPLLFLPLYMAKIYNFFLRMFRRVFRSLLI